MVRENFLNVMEKRTARVLARQSILICCFPGILVLVQLKPKLQWISYLKKSAKNIGLNKL